MAKITELDSITAAEVDTANDLITVVDVSEGPLDANKKMTIDEARELFAGGGASLLDELEDVEVADANDGDVLMRDASNGQWVAQPLPDVPEGGATNLDELDDVDVAGANDGDVLTRDASNGRWVAAPPAESGGPGATALGDLTDVDLTGAQDGDVLTLDLSSGLWVAAAPTGGSGSGTPATEVPVVVQSVHTRAEGVTSKNITLPGTPTVGNLLILIWSGPGGANRVQVPSTFNLVDGNMHDTTVYGTGLDARGPANQGAWIATRRVQSGDTATFASGTISTDNHNFTLIEVDDADLIQFHPTTMFVSGANFKIWKRRPAFPALRYLVVEHDQTQNITFDAQTGLTSLSNYSPTTGNHRAAICQVTESFDADVTGSFAAAPTTPGAYWFIIAKTTGAGGSGGASMLDDLTDVSVAGARDGDMMVYDQSNGGWVAAPPPSIIITGQREIITPSAGDFVYEGNASGSIAAANNGVQVFAPNNGSTYNARAAYQRAIGDFNNFDLIARLQSIIPHNMGGGGTSQIYVRNSNGRMLIGNDSGNGGTVSFQRWTNDTTFSANVGSATVGRGAMHYPWRRFRCIAGVLEFLISCDGESWQSMGIATDAFSSFLTAAGGTVNQLGFSAHTASGSWNYAICTHFAVS